MRIKQAFALFLQKTRLLLLEELHVYEYCSVRSETPEQGAVLKKAQYSACVGTLTFIMLSFSVTI